MRIEIMNASLFITIFPTGNAMQTTSWAFSSIDSNAGTCSPATNSYPGNASNLTNSTPSTNALSHQSTFT